MQTVSWLDLEWMLLSMYVHVFVQFFVCLPSMTLFSPQYTHSHRTPTPGVFLPHHGYCWALPGRVEASPMKKYERDFTTYNNLSSQTITYIAVSTIDVRSFLLHEPLYFANVLSVGRLLELSVQLVASSTHSVNYSKDTIKTTTKTSWLSPRNLQTTIKTVLSRCGDVTRLSPSSHVTCLLFTLTGTPPLSVSKGSQTEAQVNTRNSATIYVMSTQCGILLMCHVT